MSKPEGTTPEHFLGIDTVSLRHAGGSSMMMDKTLESDTKDEIFQATPEVSTRKGEKSLPKNRNQQVANEVTSARTRAVTHEEESSDIDLPDMFEYENWWMEAEQPMTDQQLADFLKQNLWRKKAKNYFLHGIV